MMMEWLQSLKQIITPTTHLSFLELPAAVLPPYEYYLCFKGRLFCIEVCVCYDKVLWHVFVWSAGPP